MSNGSTAKWAAWKLPTVFFSSAEVKALNRLPTENQKDRFLDYWTLKESYIKARGMGLAIPLDEFSFDLETAGGISFGNDAVLQDSPEKWDFALFDVKSDIRGALCLSNPEKIQCPLKVWKMVPGDIQELFSPALRAKTPCLEVSSI